MPLRLLVLALALGAAGCDDQGLGNDLVEVRWALQDVVLPPGDTTRGSPTSITFTSETAVVIESCNACSGPVGRSSNELDFSAFARGEGCTEKACAGTLDLGPRLGTADRVVYSLSDDGLLLIADQGGALSTFRFEAKDE